MFGITENGDASMNYDWMEKCYTMDGTILITKKLTDGKADITCTAHTAGDIELNYFHNITDIIFYSNASYIQKAPIF